MTKLEMQAYIKRIYGSAYSVGLVHSVTEMAKALEIDKSGLSSALNGNEKYITNSLVKKVKNWAILNGLEEGELSPSAKPMNMGSGYFMPHEAQAMFDNMAETIRLQAQMLATMQAASPFMGASLSTSPKNLRTEK